jgi:transcription antitermination factor NusG
MTAQWHIVRTETGREATACEWLERLKIETYRPLRHVANYRWRKPRACSLFPGYIFGCADFWPWIRELPGVIGHLMSDGSPALLSSETIDKIREYEVELTTMRHWKWPFKPGDPVRTTDSAGFFANHHGLLQRLDKNDLATVEMVALGQLKIPAQRLELDHEQIPRWRRRPKDLAYPLCSGRT